MRGWSALALGVACMTIGAAAGWFGRGVAEVTVPMQRFANDALVSHVVFSPESKHVVEVPADEEAHLVTWLSRRLDAQLHIPDLTSLGYRLIGGRQTVVATTVHEAQVRPAGRIPVAAHDVRLDPVSYTHLTLPTIVRWCRSRWSPYH